MCSLLQALFPTPFHTSGPSPCILSAYHTCKNICTHLLNMCRNMKDPRSNVIRSRISAGTCSILYVKWSSHSMNLRIRCASHQVICCQAGKWEACDQPVWESASWPVRTENAHMFRSMWAPHFLSGAYLCPVSIMLREIQTIGHQSSEGCFWVRTPSSPELRGGSVRCTFCLSVHIALCQNSGWAQFLAQQCLSVVNYPIPSLS